MHLIVDYNSNDVTHNCLIVNYNSSYAARHIGTTNSVPFHKASCVASAFPRLLLLKIIFEMAQLCGPLRLLGVKCKFQLIAPVGMQGLCDGMLDKGPASVVFLGAYLCANL